VRLARAGLGPVDYWMKLPFSEVCDYMMELTNQLEQEHEAVKAG
jgi:hypothetical protein